MLVKIPVALCDNDGHGFAPTHRNGDILDANRDRVAADDALMQYLDAGAFDKAELDQPALEFGIRECRICVTGGEMLDHARIAALGQSQRLGLFWFGLFGHPL